MLRPDPMIELRIADFTSFGRPGQCQPEVSEEVNEGNNAPHYGTWKLEACPERNRRIGRWRVEIEVGLVPSYDVLGVTSNSSVER